MDRYAVIGNPIAQSKSPSIHEAFARASGQVLTYERILGPLGGFVEAVQRFAEAGGRGLNVTAPFKREALAIAARASERAQAAGASNTLAREGDAWYADNTDGAGLVRDLTVNLGVALAGADLLLLGAGGAARGVLLPLLAQKPRSIVISNRTASKADALVERFGTRGPLDAIAPGALGNRRFDVVINATSAGLDPNAVWPWSEGLFAADGFAYDMIYGNAPTPFLRWAAGQGVTRTADGLGMLVEQAAESFFLWRGVRPPTADVYTLLRPPG